MADKKVGTVDHYFDKIQVAVVKLTGGDIKLGDELRLTGKDNELFTQKVKSMQIEHAAIDIAKKGDEFGLKVEKEVKAKTDVLKVK